MKLRGQFSSNLLKSGLIRGVRVMVFNFTFNNISVLSWVSFIGGENRSTRRKPPTAPGLIRGRAV